MSTISNSSNFSSQGADNVPIPPLGQAFLSALVGLIQPIIRTYVLPSRTANYGSSAVSEAEVIQQEGQELLSALDKFIANTVQRQMRENMNQSDNRQTLKTDSEIIRTRRAAKWNVFGSISPQVNSVLPSSIVEGLRRHVFNHMPIRLLAFHSDGSNPHLIERKDILNHILRTAYELKHNRAVNFTLNNEGLNLDFVNTSSRYAILSHTWIRNAPGDVVFNDWDTRHLNKRGYSKITKFCEVSAVDYGVTLGWMDTVCINKDSSSELDESIRSMYNWYREAHVCVVYLADTEHPSQMAQDCWFTRGWTLQELLAPYNIQFYSKNWRSFREFHSALSPISKTISTQIEMATTITADELRLCRLRAIDEIPMSRKMQLGANRQVTREEDMAYSLMGILGVDIPIAYGEGSSRAFSRLVQAFLTSQFYTLDVFNHSICGVLVPHSITQYANRSSAFDDPNVANGSHLSFWQPERPMIITHLGVQVRPIIISAIQTSFLKQFENYQELGPFMTVNVHWQSLSSEISQFESTEPWPDERTEYVTSFSPTFLPMLQRMKPVILRQIQNQHPLRSRYIIDLGIINIKCPENDRFIWISKEKPALALPLTNKFWMAHQKVDFPGWSQLEPFTNKPIVFNWEGPEKVPKEDLEAHGMRIQTLYL